MRFKCVLMVFFIAAGAELAQGQTVVLSQIAVGGGYTTEISLLNSDLVANAAATGRLFFFMPDGSPWVVQTQELGTGSTFDLTINSRGSRRITVVSSGGVAVGSARFVPLNSIAVGGVATYTFGGTAVGVIPSVSTNLVYIPLVVRPGFVNGVAVTNTSLTTNFLQFDLLGPNGQLVPGSRIPLGVNGQVARLVNQELGFPGAIAPGSTLRVTSTSGNFGALALTFGDGYISSGTVHSELESPMYLPQVALGGGYQMQIAVFNPFPFAIGGTLRFRDNSGQPARHAVQTVVGSTGSFVSDTIEVPSIGPLGSAVWDITSTNPDGPVSTGSAQWSAFAASNPVSRIPAASGVSATIFNGPIHVGQAGTTPFHAMLVPVDIQPDRNTGLALANPSGESSIVSRFLFDSIGISVRSAPTLLLQGNHQRAEYATQTFTSFTPVSGTMLIVTSEAGGFVGFPLLESRGVFSSTAAVRAVTVSPSQYAGAYSGSWNNVTVARSGPIRVAVNVNPSGQSASIAVDADGPVFGGGNPPAEIWSCTLVFFSSAQCLGTVNSPTLGLTVFNAKSDGTFFLRGQPIQGTSFINIDGIITPAMGRALYSVGLNADRSVGVINLAR